MDMGQFRVVVVALTVALTSIYSCPNFSGRWSGVCKYESGLKTFLIENFRQQGCDQIFWEEILFQMGTEVSSTESDETHSITVTEGFTWEGNLLLRRTGSVTTEKKSGEVVQSQSDIDYFSPASPNRLLVSTIMVEQTAPKGESVDVGTCVLDRK